MKSKSESPPPPTEHSTQCVESGPPAMAWQQQIWPGLPLIGRCRRCGAVARKWAGR